MDKIIKNILKKLENNGYQAFIVGGYVRNYLMGIESTDVDICTNALPKDIIEVLNLDKSTIDNYGCISIKTKKYNIDITTFRKESNYQDHKPKEVTYVNDLKTDLKRRDFTMNAIVINSEEEIIDYYNGIKDLENRVIKCIGSTNERLTEDPLRMLRAIRFSTIYDFELDDDIKNFIFNNRSLISELSFYRKKEELDKIFSSSNRIKGLNKIKELNLLSSLDLKYNNLYDTNDILGIYAQIEYSDEYPLNKNEKDIINKIRSVLEYGTIDNVILYRYGLYICIVAGEILGIDYIKINRMYKKLPIKSKKDIKISVESIVKLNNNCYNDIGNIFSDLEEKILTNKLKNKSSDIVRYLRK